MKIKYSTHLGETLQYTSHERINTSQFFHIVIPLDKIIDVDVD